jgi:hypothetical protein
MAWIRDKMGKFLTNGVSKMKAPKMGKPKGRFWLIYGIIAAMLSLTIAMGALAGNVPVVGADGLPTTYYLWADSAPATTNPGELMHLGSMGTSPTTKTINSVGTWYWYSDEEYPTGGDPAYVEAGTYTFHMDFTNNMFFSSAYLTFTVEVGYANSDGTGYTKIAGPSASQTFDKNTASPQNITIGSGAKTDLVNKRVVFRLDVTDIGFFADGIDLRYQGNTADYDTHLDTPGIMVTEKAWALLGIAPFIPLMVHRIRKRRKGK